MTNPMRTCLACGQADDHPRHDHVLPDHSTVSHHFDCGNRMMPPCESCAVRLRSHDGQNGEQMRRFLLDNPPQPAADATPQGSDA